MNRLVTTAMPGEYPNVQIGYSDPGCSDAEFTVPNGDRVWLCVDKAAGANAVWLSPAEAFHVGQALVRAAYAVGHEPDLQPVNVSDILCVISKEVTS